jgi:hypothetical protein
MNAESWKSSQFALLLKIWNQFENTHQSDGMEIAEMNWKILPKGYWLHKWQLISRKQSGHNKAMNYSI